MTVRQLMTGLDVVEHEALAHCGHLPASEAKKLRKYIQRVVRALRKRIRREDQASWRAIASLRHKQRRAL